MICSFTRSTIRSCWKWEWNLQIKLMRTDEDWHKQSKAPSGTALEHHSLGSFFIPLWGSSFTLSHLSVKRKTQPREWEKREGLSNAKVREIKEKHCRNGNHNRQKGQGLNYSLNNLVSCFDLMTNKIVRLWNKASKIKIAKASELTIKSVTKW